MVKFTDYQEIYGKLKMGEYVNDRGTLGNICMIKSTLKAQSFLIIILAYTFCDKNYWKADHRKNHGKLVQFPNVLHSFNVG